MTGRAREGGLRRFVTAPPGKQPAGPGAVPAGPGRAATAPLPGLRSVAREPGEGPPESQAPATSPEKCEMCGAGILESHGHVADLERSALLCTCRPCYLLFTHSQAGRGRYRAVPDRYLSDPQRPLSPAEWEELEIPVGLAFFLLSSQRDQLTAFYPSPAGATECTLDLAAWQRLAVGHPLLRAAEPDVEAVLIHRSGDVVEHYLVPIDACYVLAGRMRLLWHGFDGGAEARESIAEFLGQTRARAKPLGEEP